MSLVTLPKTVRTFARLRVIAQVLSRHGFGHFVERLQLQRYMPSIDWLRRVKQPEGPEVDPLEAIGARLVRVCEELGPTFVKLGQMASTRPDVLPQQVLTALSRLQDDVAPFPSEQARRLFHDDVGMSVEKVFREFAAEPFASGSIGQVHRARTADGQDVVVKIKRPGIDNTVHLDIYVLQWMADRAEALFPELRPYHPKMLVDEFAQTIRRELDFINEASTTSRFHEAFEDDPHIRTPQVRWDLTGPSVLTMEYMSGIRLREALTQRRAECDLPALARNLSECFLKQFFELGFFHADPHPGNLLLSPPDDLVIFDFGMVSQMDDELAGRLVIGIVAAVNREIDVVIDVLADMGALGKNTDRRVLAGDLRAMLDKYYGLPIKRLDFGSLFPELIETVRRNDVILPRDFVALFKSLSTVSGVVLQLDPNFNLLELIKPKLTRMLAERASPRRIARMMAMSSWHILNIVRDAPRLVRDIMRGMGRGHFQINIRHENIDYLASELDRSSNRLAFSVLMAATIVGSSMVLSMATEVKILHFPIRYLAFGGYFLSFVMGIGLLIAIIRSGKMS
jgi:ubiquinone biosynthesis protein